MHTTEAVQSCILSMNLPNNIEDYECGLLNVEDETGKKENDIEVLLHFRPDRHEAWTAPKWLTSGDIMFFYLTKKYKIRALKLLKEAPGELLPYIKKADNYANIYSGTIFACADISDSSFYGGEAVGPQTKSRIFAPLKSLHVFKNPIPLSEFDTFIKIRQGSITPLFGKAFDSLVEVIGAKNALPKSLENKKSEKGFNAIDKSNWIKISCTESKRFLNEDQLREFFVDYFIEYLKDARSKIFKECACYRKSSFTGTVDYFININKIWIPVEAKLNVKAEKNLFKQIDRYIHIDHFDSGKGKIASPKVPVCLLIDQSGLYITNDAEFIECNYDHPYLKRGEITMARLIKLRAATPP